MSDYLAMAFVPMVLAMVWRIRRRYPPGGA